MLSLVVSHEQYTFFRTANYYKIPQANQSFVIVNLKHQNKVHFALNILVSCKCQLVHAQIPSISIFLLNGKFYVFPISSGKDCAGQVQHHPQVAIYNSQITSVRCFCFLIAIKRLI